MDGVAWSCAVFVAALVSAWLLTRFLIGHLVKHEILAQQNERSMHGVPTPVGGGWAIVLPVLLALLPSLPAQRQAATFAIVGGFILLAFVSWVDDRQDLPRLVRLAVQVFVVVAALALSPSDLIVFSSHWPLWADRLATALCWLWFINLFNFMDGIDALAGLETLFISLGLLLIGLWLGHDWTTLSLLMTLMGAVIGFLWYNWPPARIFLGDVGAIPLGFLLGWLLIRLAGEGHLAAAFLLPGYFLADASVTLLRRLLAGEAFWTPHRDHFYQRAALALGSHARVLWRIIPLNAALLLLALVALRWPVPAFVAGLGLIISALAFLRRDAIVARSKVDTPDNCCG